MSVPLLYSPKTKSYDEKLVTNVPIWGCLRPYEEQGKYNGLFTPPIPTGLRDLCDHRLARLLVGG